MTLTINYKNGKSRTWEVNYFVRRDDKYIFAVNHQVRSLGYTPVEIPVENVVSFEVEEN
jgi:hypothetical protein